MSDWTAGYIADIGYTHGYYTELNPLRIKLAFLHRGLVFPDVGAACELGFGQGLSANIHAAASVTEWHGTDFNPAQAGYAQELARASGANTKLYDQAFAEFAARTDLPDFDFIALHGIWSWISDDNRAVIVDFIRRKLKVGGVLYVSYNALPGWSSFAPLRHLMTAHAEVLGTEGKGIVSRVEGAMEFANKLLATNPLFARANPMVAERLKSVAGQNRQYLAHEYFNRDWHPMHFATMAEWMEGGKVQFACSANYLDHIDALHLTAEQQALLNEIPDPMFRETTRDFMINQQFRKDYWVKGARKLTTLEQAELLQTQRVILCVHPRDLTLKVGGALGEAGLNEAVYSPLLDLLADHKPHTIAQLSQSLGEKGVGFAQVLQAVVVLAGAGHLAAVQNDPVIHKARKQTDRLNNHLCQQARSSHDVTFLASPVTGGGISVGRFPQLFLMCIGQGKRQPEEWAQYAWQTVAAQGQRLLKDGKALETAEENLSHLKAQAEVFAAKQLPVLKALQVV